MYTAFFVKENDFFGLTLLTTKKYVVLSAYFLKAK